MCRDCKTIQKFSFLFCEPFSSIPLCCNFSSLAVHELRLPRKAFKGIQGGGAGTNSCVDDCMSCLGGGLALRQNTKKLSFLFRGPLSSMVVHEMSTKEGLQRDPGGGLVLAACSNCVETVGTAEPV